MTPEIPFTRDLVLVGGGHAHALVLRRWGMDPLPGARLTVVNPGPTAPYTGMLPGHVAGHYTRDELDIDLVKLARYAGARLIDGKVEAIDPGMRRLTIPGRAALDYDVASIDIGITAEMPELPGFMEHGTGAKPLDRFAEGWRTYRDAALAGDLPANVAVIGGGVAGVELAMAMAHALRVRNPTVTVIEPEPAVTGVGPATRSRLEAAMASMGVAFRGGARVASVEAEAVVLEDGERVPSAFVTGAAGARPHPWVAGSGLPVRDGFIRVGRTLQVLGHPTLFAVGDCAYLEHSPRPKAGVFAVRQAPVLHENLRAMLSGGRPRIFRPQSRYLKLISLGGRSALAERGGASLTHPLLWRWKDRIDRDFMEKLTDLPEMARPTPPKPSAEGVAEALAGKPLCGGCGAKVGPRTLATALAALPAPLRDDVLSRPGDDAAVLTIGGVTQVVSTDHLRAFTADPYLMARIATVHALGDIWAMGARPQAALASIVLPRMSPGLQARTLAEILPAIRDVLGEEGADLVGGHTTLGAEATIGLTVTGLAERDPIGLDGALPGDALILTRPLGTGILLAAEMAGAARGADILAMLQGMARSQGTASALLRGSHAMTDVTGFGLAGHLGAICRSSGTGAEIVLRRLPAYDGALALAEAGQASSLLPENQAAAPVEGAEGPRAALLHDPQTAGGLLAAVDAAEADTLLDRLRDAGIPAVRIGAITEGPPVLRCR